MTRFHRLITGNRSARRHGRATPPAAKVTGRGTLLRANESHAPRTRRTRRPSPGIVLLLAATLLAAVACSGRGAGTGTPELPPACDQFVTKYESCLKATIPSLPALAKQRSSQTRTALEQEARRGTTATTAAAATASLTALATKCQDNLQRLTASCGSSPTH
jgi:hypothetical protein